jgi:hypothetical protein
MRSASREKDSRISFWRLPHLARKSLDGAAMALDADYAARLAPGAPRVILLVKSSPEGRGVRPRWNKNRAPCITVQQHAL